ncbi:MAG: oligopeptide/dipeptide ABC transporter ATP-binding protein [Marmoricola sp.]
MYLGRIVEEGIAAEVVGTPRHPYTQALLSVVPERDPLRTRAPLLLVGEPPNAANAPPVVVSTRGARMAQEQCEAVDPGTEADQRRSQCGLCVGGVMKLHPDWPAAQRAEYDASIAHPDQLRDAARGGQCKTGPGHQRGPG